MKKKNRKTFRFLCMLQPIKSFCGGVVFIIGLAGSSWLFMSLGLLLLVLPIWVLYEYHNFYVYIGGA